MQREAGGWGLQEETEIGRESQRCELSQVLCSILVIALFCLREHDFWDFPGGSVVKNLPISAGNIGLIYGPGCRLWCN